MQLRILVSRHSAFYTPLIATLAGGFSSKEGLEATYGLLQPGQTSRDMINTGQADIIQSGVSSNWIPMEKGITGLPVHFAQINRRDGFFLAARRPDLAFDFHKLEGRTLLADHAAQPLAMLRYALRVHGVDWKRIHVIDAGDVNAMDAAFRDGTGDYVHQQGPAPQQLEHDGLGFVVACIGDAMPPVAFSSLTASREFLSTEPAHAFLRAYRSGKAWVNRSPAREVAETVAHFFPAIDIEPLASAIARYQDLGCWHGDAEIPRDLYEQALEVFLAAGLITRRYPYDEVVYHV